MSSVKLGDFNSLRQANHVELSIHRSVAAALKLFTWQSTQVLRLMDFLPFGKVEREGGFTGCGFCRCFFLNMVVSSVQKV